MGWFSKKEKVPELPESPNLPEFPKKEEGTKKELPELPSFPNNPKNENFNQEMVKSAVGDSSHGENSVNVRVAKASHVDGGVGGSMIPPKPSSENNLSEPSHQQPEHQIPEPPRATIREAAEAQRTEGIPQRVETPRNIAPPRQMPQKRQLPLRASPLQKSPEKNDEPIFIRIDKFQSAQKNFENIKTKIQNIESTLNQIIDIKEKEEEEIKGWSKEVQMLKAKLSEVDSDIFNKI